MSSDRVQVVELGRKLAESFDESDIVGRWMSHHLADLIARNEATPDDRGLAAETSELILRIWERKLSAPFQTEPLRYLRPVLKAVARLERSPQPWSHYGTFTEGTEPPASDLAALPMLEVVCALDRAVGRLVRLGVAVTAREALDREQPWVVAATNLADSEEDRAIRALERIKSLMTMRGYVSGGESEESNADTASDASEGCVQGTADLSGDPDQGSTGQDVLLDELAVTLAECNELLRDLGRLVGSQTEGPTPAPES